MALFECRLRSQGKSCLLSLSSNLSISFVSASGPGALLLGVNLFKYANSTTEEEEEWEEEEQEEEEKSYKTHRSHQTKKRIP